MSFKFPTQKFMLGKSKTGGHFLAETDKQEEKVIADEKSQAMCTRNTRTEDITVSNMSFKHKT